jgi:histidinol phosphatase-like PHP family hydrolase
VRSAYPCIEPELRESQDEIALALACKLPRLVTDKDLCGILHVHTEMSDGVDTLEVITEATRALGYQYFGVADHSKSAHYAGGLSIEEIEQQHAEIDRLNKRYGRTFRILKGIESDILPDGSLDYPDDVLERFDLVVASVHSRFKLDRNTQTERILRAVATPYTTILGHMTGRQLLRRPGYEVDIERILKACAEYGVAVEINGNPWRLDLDWRWHRRALELGCIMSINPDAHSTDEIDLTHRGVEMARKLSSAKSRAACSSAVTARSRALRRLSWTFAITAPSATFTDDWLLAQCMTREPMIVSNAINRPRISSSILLLPSCQCGAAYHARRLSVRLGNCWFYCLGMIGMVIDGMMMVNTALCARSPLGCLRQMPSLAAPAPPRIKQFATKTGAEFLGINWI